MGKKWGFTFPTYLKKTSDLQNKAVKLIRCGYRKKSVTPFFSELEILQRSELLSRLENRKIDQCPRLFQQ